MSNSRDDYKHAYDVPTTDVACLKVYSIQFHVYIHTVAQNKLAIGHY